MSDDESRPHPSNLTAVLHFGRPLLGKRAKVSLEQRGFIKSRSHDSGHPSCDFVFHSVSCWTWKAMRLRHD
jgi:hypothetical protein